MIRIYFLYFSFPQNLNWVIITIVDEESLTLPCYFTSKYDETFLVLNKISLDFAKEKHTTGFSLLIKTASWTVRN